MSSRLRAYITQWKKGNIEIKNDIKYKNVEIIERKDIIKLVYSNIDKTNITSEQIEKIYLKYPNLKSILNLVHEFRDI